MKNFKPIPWEVEKYSRPVLDSAYAVHTKLGPGLLESVYESCLALELQRRGLKFGRQVPLPIVYDGVKIEGGFRVDLLVEDSLVVELKSVEDLLPVHGAQLLTYLKLSNVRLGFLVNFNVVSLKRGIKRLVL